MYLEPKFEVVKMNILAGYGRGIGIDGCRVILTCSKWFTICTFCPFQMRIKVIFGLQKSVEVVVK